MKWNLQKHLKCRRLVNLLWAEHTTMRYNRSKEDREDVNDDACSGRPSMSVTDENIEAMKKMILENRRITIREVADNVAISFVSCQAIFTDALGTKHTAA